MSKITRNLLIGEKIGFGFGLVGLIFLIVIWQYHNTLQQSLGDYQQLQNVVVAKKVDMLSIQNSMRGALQAEKEFLLYRDENFSSQVDQQLQQSLLTAADLSKIDRQLFHSKLSSCSKTISRNFRRWWMPGARRDWTTIPAYRARFEMRFMSWRQWPAISR